jgi:hypothetical protein
MRTRTMLTAAALLTASALLNGLPAADVRTQEKTGEKAQPSGDTVPVTADNFIRAETDQTFAGIVKQGGLGKFHHFRELSSVGDHIVKRANRDTLYSVGVFDLDAGPLTITLPAAGKRFMTMIVIEEDHYVFTVVYGPGSHTVTKDKIGTRYALAAIRILVDPNDPKDVAQVHTLQDAVKVEQRGGPGKFEILKWDEAGQKKVREALVVLGETIPDWRRAAGRKDEVDPVRHLIVTATGWGLNPDKDAIYLNVTPKQNDGKTVYKLTVKDVPVDGFWSISLYNAEGYFEPNKENAYTLNNLTAKKNEDGSVTIQFGGCDGKTANCLPVVKGWNYMVRLYCPRKEILDGTWKFPEAQPAK